jgi:hypothetical protein
MPVVGSEYTSKLLKTYTDVYIDLFHTRRGYSADRKELIRLLLQEMEEITKIHLAVMEREEKEAQVKQETPLAG